MNPKAIVLCSILLFSESAVIKDCCDSSTNMNAGGRQ